jgi:hypothetical protein
MEKSINFFNHLVALREQKKIKRIVTSS